MKLKRTFLFTIEDGWNPRDFHDAVEDFYSFLKLKRIRATKRIPRRTGEPGIFNSKSFRRGKLWIQAVQGFYPFDEKYGLTLECREK